MCISRIDPTTSYQSSRSLLDSDPYFCKALLQKRHCLPEMFAMHVCMHIALTLFHISPIGCTCMYACCFLQVRQASVDSDPYFSKTLAQKGQTASYRWLLYMYVCILQRNHNQVPGQTDRRRGSLLSIKIFIIVCILFPKSPSGLY